MPACHGNDDDDWRKGVRLEKQLLFVPRGVCACVHASIGYMVALNCSNLKNIIRAFILLLARDGGMTGRLLN